MRSFLKIAVAAGAVVATSGHAFAVTANVPFAGVVTATCVLTVGTPGTLAANTSFDVLSSTAAGGLPGTIAALSTGTTFKVSAIAPTAFTLAPATGGDSVNFSTQYQASGATTRGATPGTTETTLNLGLTNLTINLAATKSVGNFAGGAYAAEVVVRCE